MNNKYTTPNLQQINFKLNLLRKTSFFNSSIFIVNYNLQNKYIILCQRN